VESTGDPSWNLTSDEHFTVDGTLIEAWASLKSFQCKEQKSPPPDDPGNPTIDFHGETRSNQTHESTTDPDALLARKGSGKEAKHALLQAATSLCSAAGVVSRGIARR
jgi:hypothetical protein